ncbi:MAG: hypothetical protein JSV80_08240 [Acidobacteriota bacterium]|nr:MAG: hypothetical protein JSV80_08240 [Acidobacteriota bacterium]
MSPVSPPLRCCAVFALLNLGPLPCAAAAELPTTQEVLDRFVEAVGGRQALEAIDVRHCRGMIVQDLTWKDPQHQETPFLAETDAEGCVLYAESADWTALPSLDTGEPRRKLRWIMHPRFALVIADFFPELAAAGREVRDGRNVIVLAPRDLPFEHYALYFDEETGLLNHIGYHNDLEQWSDYDGVLLPTRWIFGRKGGHTTYVFHEIANGPAPGSS